MPPITIKVLLAEDHKMVREGLRNLLEHEQDIVVAGEATNGHQAVELARKLHPDVIVMDIAMPKLNGMEATRRIRQTDPDVKILILSAHSDDAYVEGALAAGASGYLIKQTSVHTLIEAIREVIQKGDAFFSPEVGRRLLKRRQESLEKGGCGSTNVPSLTSREMEVLQQIAEGEANKQIAGSLCISVKTVEKHRDHLMRKLNIHDTAGITRYAIAAGIIENTGQCP
ncbi:MAG: response regulator transcription factor, partial [Kiritimatiellae bacterium]|nr:response regulator transcription factor [Kiritimatiellia bacterium]